MHGAPRFDDWLGIPQMGEYNPSKPDLAKLHGKSMVLASISTSALLVLLDRFRAGDAAAANELVAELYARLQTLARQMLGASPKLRETLEADDLLHRAQSLAASAGRIGQAFSQSGRRAASP